MSDNTNTNRAAAAAAAAAAASSSTHHSSQTPMAGVLTSEVATAFLTALDTSLAKKWREEDRCWREEDVEYRKEEREYRIVEQLYREQNLNWRKSDVQQRTLDNARVIWNRHVEKNRRDVEEKSEQLKSISNLSALIAGFAVVALVELDFNRDDVSEWLIALYAGSTALVVGLMLNAMVLCTFILSSILKRGKSYVSEDEEAEFLFRCRKFAAHFKPGDFPPQPKRTFERHWENRCEDSWKKAFFMFTAGVPVFVANLACCAWLKFAYSSTTSGIVSGIAFISLLVWTKTNKDWGWEIARGSGGFRLQNELMGKGSRRSILSEKINGLPFDWHARPGDESYAMFEDHDDGDGEDKDDDIVNKSNNENIKNDTPKAAHANSSLHLDDSANVDGKNDREEKDGRVFVTVAGENA